MKPQPTAEPTVTVRRATTADRDTVAELIGAAFMEDPVSRWVFPDDEHRRAVHAAFFGVFLDDCLRHGWADVTDDLAAAAMWLPVGTEGATSADEDDLARRLVAVGSTERGAVVGELTAAAHPTAPHYYLPMIGALPDRQGGGRGRALITHVTDRCDAQGLPTYLEASNPRSRALYERLGFVFTGTTVDLPDGPSLWPMWREPRGAEPGAF